MGTMPNMRRAARFTMVGAAAAGYLSAKATLGTWPHAERDFFRRRDEAADDLELPTGRRVDLPIHYYRDDSFMGIFSAAYEPVRASLPSDRLFPVELPGGRTAVAVYAFDYIDTSFGLSYGEVAICPACTFGRRIPGALSLLLQGRLPGFGGFVLHLPVTARAARDGGRIGWGYAKFVADMDFVRRPDHQSVHLAEGGAHILTLTVKQRGLCMRDNRPLVTYSVLDGDLVRTTIPSRAVYQLDLRPGSGTLDLGDHEIADQLRRMELSPRAVVTQNFLSRSGILPRGKTLARADRPHDGYVGAQREFGRLTVDYDPGAPPVDVYARHRAAVEAQ